MVLCWRCGRTHNASSMNHLLLTLQWRPITTSFLCKTVFSPFIRLVGGGVHRYQTGRHNEIEVGNQRSTRTLNTGPSLHTRGLVALLVGAHMGRHMAKSRPQN